MYSWSQVWTTVLMVNHSFLLLAKTLREKRSIKCSESIKSLSHVPLFATPWTLAHQSPLSMGFPRQEYLSGFPFSRGSS